ncbi:MAG: radical SAM protein [Bradymonadaceae bacterium]|nr:radical SAM protein [Lujinxingiaceae bacterium]
MAQHLNFEALLERAAPPKELPAPTLALSHLDTLWLQVTGTLCNLACLHCFISCGPKNHNHEMMTLESVQDALNWARDHGVKEFYFTGGEPFMHPQIKEMILAALEHGPLNILTNGILIDESMAAWLGEVFRTSRYNLDLRVSLDGTTPEENDAIRGRKTYEKIFGGIDRLWAHGVNPVITVTTCHADLAAEDGRRRFYEVVRARGLSQPRLKFLSPFKIGREEHRAGGYEAHERLVEGDLIPGQEDALQCSSCRMVTAKGVYPCPILIEVDEALMGASLDDALVDIKLDHPACYTCHVEGVTCRT